MATEAPVPVAVPMEVDEDGSSAPSSTAGSGVWDPMPLAALATEESVFPTLEVALTALKPKRPVRKDPNRLSLAQRRDANTPSKRRPRGPPGLESFYKKD